MYIQSSVPENKYFFSEKPMAPNDGRRYPCEKCDSTLKTRHGLECHKKASYGGKVLKCDQCNYSTRLLQGLKRHKETAHDGIVHKCEECGKNFTQAGTLGRHKSIAHEGLLFSCDFCSHKARRRSELAHEACNICDKIFHRKFICRFIPGKTHMYAPVAMKRHTTTCAILPKCLNVKYVAKISGAVEV